MRNELTQNTVNILKERFDIFHDGMIHNIQLDLMRYPEPNKMKIIVAANDWYTVEVSSGAEKKTEVVKVTFEIEGLTQYIIRQPENYQQVVIYRLNIGFFDDQVYLDFNPLTDDATKKQYYTTESRPGTTSYLLQVKDAGSQLRILNRDAIDALLNSIDSVRLAESTPPSLLLRLL